MGDDSSENVSKILARIAMSNLRSYQGNLASAVQVAGNGWLPEPDDPLMADHLEALREHLASSGRVDVDPYLMRLGLTTPGKQRGIVPPLMVLQPNRGGFSKKRHDEAAGTVTRLQEVLTIGRWFLPNLNHDTQQAIAELLDLSQVNSPWSDIERLASFQQLSKDEASQLAELAIKCLDSEERSVGDIGIEALRGLTCFREEPLSRGTCQALLERGVFNEAILYRESGDQVAEYIFHLIGNELDTLSLNHFLLLMAWTRSHYAKQVFQEWADNPPAWANKLYVPPAEYLLSTGWCLEENGQMRELVAKQCMRLAPTDKQDSGVIHARSRLHNSCPACSSRLFHLFDFSEVILDLQRLGFSGAPIKVLACLYCSYYGPVFAKYGADGTTEFLGATERAESSNLEEYPISSRSICAFPCPTFACAETYGLGDATTLGGLPMWLQDAEYPRCFDCGRYMHFFAQHDNGSLGEEGIYYAFYCEDCHVSAVSYQQT